MEPKIIVNGVYLTPAQSMTTRVALNNFMIDLSCHGLGDDKHGKEMCEAYQERITEINKIIMEADKI